MAKKKAATKQKDLFNIQEQLSTAACVPAIREAVKAWRADKYKGITETTRELLNFWFHTDHVLHNGQIFRYHLAQREAIETLIFIYEVKKVRNRKQLLETYAFNTKDLRLPPYDDFARYCVKMATGSGKTKVMAMAIVWQFANAIKEDETQYAKNFLVLAPNVIVFDRLRTDFESGRIFRTDPLIPKHFQWWWEMEYYMRGDTERTNSQGSLYLTNIQQFYERGNRTAEKETDIMTAMLGEIPPTSKSEVSDFDVRITKREGLLMVLNDEAHHTHDEESEWNKFIRKLHTDRPVAIQLDVSATPRYSKGSLFAWTVFDYPLKQAILDRIVKRPIKGISKIEEAKSNIASVKYRGFLTAGVERWKEYSEQLGPLKKKPILFVMMSNTEEADDIGEWMQSKYPEHFAGEKLLVIHTDTKGEISKKDLDKARKTARDVDDDKSPVNAIISVLMLREGWDVQNVTVVVGLRPYTAKANILPEQTIGRGLRLMFRNLAGFTERVDIIGNKAFMEFVDDLEKLEDLKFDTFQIGKDKLKILTVQPMEDKIEFDIGIPDISPILGRKKSLADEIAAIDVMKFNINKLPLKGKEIEDTKTFIYEGRDILTDEKLLEREYSIPPAQTAEEVIGYYARRIAQNIKLPSQFAVLAPKLREFFERKAFGQTVDLADKNVILAMGSNVASFVVTKEFEKLLREIVIEHKEPELLSAERFLSSTPSFPTSKKILEAKKSVFNYVPCDNDFEYNFAEFLEKSDDIKAFSKLPEQFGFSIQYTDTLANIRNYYPDFIAVAEDATKWIIETKGREDIEVRLKDNAAINWCGSASSLTKDNWRYLKVPQNEFEKLHPDSFEELQAAINPPALF
ncbi:MAG: DEAD/DEAH box helicase family protein [Bacteroidota bacterium]|nr:DEAD/DEAH box helicase family protein [Bacteroidota bacterium]